MVAATYDELANIARTEGHLDEARAHLDRALAIKSKADPEPNLVRAAYTEVSLAQLLLDEGRLEDARAAIDDALDIERKRVPTGDPARADALVVLGNLLVAERRPAAAVAPFEEALALIERKAGPNSSSLLDALEGLAGARSDAGDGARALALAERASSLATAVKATADIVGAAEFRLAQARWALGEDRAGDVAAVRALRARLAALPYRADVLPDVDRWLARVARSK